MTLRIFDIVINIVRNTPSHGWSIHERSYRCINRFQQLNRQGSKSSGAFSY